MVTDLLLQVVEYIVMGIALLLPSVALPYWSSVMGGATTVNGYLLAFDGMLPLSELIAFYRWVGTVWIPGFVAYLSVKWVWSHVPFLGSK